MELQEFLTESRMTQSEFGEKLVPPVTQGTVSQWITGKIPIPPARCVQIEKITASKVGRPDLRPIDWREIWPEIVWPYGVDQ